MLAFAVFACAALRPPPLATTKIAGDVGFDPLRLAALDVWALAAPSKRRPAAELLRDYRDAELKHGRLAMLAAVAWPLQEKLSPAIAARLQLPDLLVGTSGRSLSVLNGGLAQGGVPNFLLFFVILASMLETSREPVARDAHPAGDYGWRATRSRPGDVHFDALQEGEVWHGRVAMVATLAYVAQEAITQTPIASIIPP